LNALHPMVGTYQCTGKETLLLKPLLMGSSLSILKGFTAVSHFFPALRF